VCLSQRRAAELSDTHPYNVLGHETHMSAVKWAALKADPMTEEVVMLEHGTFLFIASISSILTLAGITQHMLQLRYVFSTC